LSGLFALGLLLSGKRPQLLVAPTVISASYGGRKQNSLAVVAGQRNRPGAISANTLPSDHRLPIC
jgi:hypothetical protein